MLTWRCVPFPRLRGVYIILLRFLGCATLTKKTKAQLTPLAKAARQSLEELSSSEDEDKPTQRGAPVTGATVSPSSSSSSSASATETAAASTANPDRSRRAATQPEAAPLPKKLDAAPKLTAPKAAVKGKAAAPKKKGKAAATSEDSSTIALWLGKTQVCVASLLKIEPPQALPHPVLSRHRCRRLRRKLN